VFKALITQKKHLQANPGNVKQGMKLMRNYSTKKERKKEKSEISRLEPRAQRSTDRKNYAQ
jgi:hypothetical protein